MDAADSRTDEALVEAANRGEHEAFEALYRRHRDWVFALARRFCPEAETAHDVLQESFLYFWSRFPGFELTARLRTYLYPVVRHTAFERARRARRYASREVPEREAGPRISPPGEVREELRPVLAALPPAQLEVVLLRFVDDLELAEIAVALEIPVGTVKSRLHHALATLREDPRCRHYFDVPPEKSGDR